MGDKFQAESQLDIYRSATDSPILYVSALITQLCCPQVNTAEIIHTETEKYQEAMKPIASDRQTEIFGKALTLDTTSFWGLSETMNEGKSSGFKPKDSETVAYNDSQSHKPEQHPTILDTFTKAWQEWADGTTLHGIKFVFDGRTPIVRRIFWFVVFGSLMYYLISMCIIQTERYLAYKTVTKTTLTLDKTLTFPAVTFCNFNLIKNNSVSDSRTRTLLKELYMKLPNVTLIKSLGDDYLKTVSLRDVFIKGTPLLNETFVMCQWLTDFQNCRKFLIEKVTESGHCYTFGAKEKNQTYTVKTTGYLAGASFVLWLNQNNYFIGDASSAGIKVMIHDPSEEPDYRFGLSVSPGYSYFVSLSKKKATFLPHPVKAFGSRKCVDTQSDEFKNPLEYYEEYSIYACMTECKAKFIQEVCYCSDTFSVGNLSECTPLQQIYCVHEAYRNFSTIFDTDLCNCPLPCNMTVYESTISSAYFPNSNYMNILIGNNSLHDLYSRENMVQVRVYYETLMTKHEEQILEFTWEDLIASFGGFLGLAIGASFITILEFFELFFVCLYRCVKGK